MSDAMWFQAVVDRFLENLPAGATAAGPERSDDGQRFVWTVEHGPATVTVTFERQTVAAIR